MLTGSLCRSSASMLVLCLAATNVQAQSRVSASTAPNGGQEPSAANVQTNATNTADIVVTASKREQKLRDVPSAITVLSSAALETQGVQTIRDYATLTPGLALRDQGQPGIGTIFIRGLSTGAGSQSATSVVYLDDVPFTSSSPRSGSQFVAPEPELADLDRIEVLKGPQGTLYGASSLGGVVRLISRRPDSSRLSGSARIEGTAIDGGGEGYALRGSLNVPLVKNSLALRATGFYRKAPGFTDNVGTGSKNVNDSVTKGGRVALGWTPNDALTVDLVGQIQETKGDGFALQDNATGSRVPLYGARKYNMFFDAPSDVKYKLASATINYDVGPGSIIATGSYNDSSTFFNRDTTGPFAAFLPAFGYAPGTGFELPTSIDLKKVTGEIRFVSRRFGRLEFVAGAYATHEKSTALTAVNAIEIASRARVPGTAGSFFYSDSRDTYDEVAGFGNVTLYLSDRLDLTGGLRYAHNEEENSQTLGGTLYGTPALPTLTTKFEDNVATYLATLRWRPTDTLSAFLRAASGYRPGGAQTNPNPPPGAQTFIRPDTVWNYEAGVKGTFLDGSLTVEASAYHIDWKDVQLQGVFGGLVLLANGGEAQVDGFELQALARPSRLLSIGMSVGYTDARITSIDAQASVSVGAVKGDPLPLTPNWTTSVTIDQRVPMANGVDGELGATLRYEADKYNSYPAAVPDVNVKLPDIATLDLRAGVHFDKYRVQIRAENVFDRNGFVNALTSGPGLPTQMTLIRPRSFTLALSTEF